MFDQQFTAAGGWFKMQNGNNATQPLLVTGASGIPLIKDS